jgi:hypothetical protein
MRAFVCKQKRAHPIDMPVKNYSSSKGSADRRQALKAVRTRKKLPKSGVSVGYERMRLDIQLLGFRHLDRLKH